MPIYDDDFGSRIVHLGSGDVIIGHDDATVAARNGASRELLIFTKDSVSGPIGDWRPEHGGETTAEYGKQCVRIVIDDPKSLEVLIERASALYATMQPSTNEAAPIEPSSDKSLRDWAEVVGKQSDTIDNLIAAYKLPMPADFHLTQIKGAMETMRDELREAYTGITGENPWSE